MLTETLTITITGDSTDLQNEVSLVERRLDELQQRISQVSSASEQIASGLSRVSQALAPLQQVSSMLSTIAQQVQQISQTPVTLNVSPAIASLQQLLSMIQMVSAQMQALSAAGSGGGGGGGFSGGDGGGYSGSGGGGDGPTYLATGGPVVGPAGIDRVPAMLTAGEFVLNRETSAALGAEFLQRLNRGGPAEIGSRSNDARNSPAATFSPPSSSTTNHFGGINIQVTETADVNSLVRDLRLQGIQLRNRRG